MKEVEKIEIRRKRKIDPKIRPLVMGLRKWRIETKMSCQGHEDRFPFPWIDISLQDTGKLLAICGWYNLKERPFLEKIKWVILPWYNIQKRLTLKKIRWAMLSMTWPSGEISIRLVPQGNAPLRKLQESAIEFGKYLQEISELPMKLKEESGQALTLFVSLPEEIILRSGG